jgi:hypothetical protein
MSANFTAMVAGNRMPGLRADVASAENMMKLNWLRLRVSESPAKDPQSPPLGGVGNLYTDASKVAKYR